MKKLLGLLFMFMSFSVFAQSVNPPDLRNRLEYAERTGQISVSDLIDLKNRVEYGDRTGELNEREAQGLRDRIAALENRSLNRSVNPPDLRRRLEQAERAGYISAEEYAHLSERIEFGDRSNELNGREAQGLRDRLHALQTNSNAISSVELNSRIDLYARGGINRRELDDIDARITQGEINGILNAGEVARLRDKLRIHYGMAPRGDARYRVSRLDDFVARVNEYQREGELRPRAAYNLKRRAEALAAARGPNSRAWRDLEIDLQRNLR